MKRFLLCALLALSCSAFAQSYEAQADKVGEMVKSGQISRVDGNREMLAAARAYYPNDRLLQDTWSHIVSLSERYQAGALSKDTYNELVTSAWDRFDQANAARHASAQQDRNALAGALFLQSFGRGLKDSSVPTGTNCQTSFIGGTASTYCN